MRPAGRDRRGCGLEDGIGMGNGVVTDNGLSHLTKRQLVTVSEFVERAVFIDTDKELANLLLDVRHLVPCDYIVCGLATTDEQGQYQ